MPAKGDLLSLGLAKCPFNKSDVPASSLLVFATDALDQVDACVPFDKPISENFGLPPFDKP